MPRKMHLTPWRPQQQYLGAALLRGEGGTGTFGVDASGRSRRGLGDCWGAVGSKREADCETGRGGGGDGDGDDGGDGGGTAAVTAVATAAVTAVATAVGRRR